MILFNAWWSYSAKLLACTVQFSVDNNDTYKAFSSILKVMVVVLNSVFQTEIADMFALSCAGQFPYPTIENEDMLNFLSEGNRLEQPPNCSDEVWVIQNLSHIHTWWYVTQSDLAGVYAGMIRWSNVGAPSPVSDRHSKTWERDLRPCYWRPQIIFSLLHSLTGNYNLSHYYICWELLSSRKPPSLCFTKPHSLFTVQPPIKDTI